MDQTPFDPFRSLRDAIGSPVFGINSTVQLTVTRNNSRHVIGAMAAMGRHIFKGLTIPLTRHYTSNTKLVEVAVNNTTGIATLSMNRPPVNSLNLDFINELTYSLQELEKSKCRGVILTSELPTVFSAGLDIMEMYKPDLKRAATFWRSLQELWLTLYGTGLPTAAAINGASPAGGCLLAMSCEYRVFVEGKHRIGLNETGLGLIAPKWFQDTMINTIGYRRAEISLLQGTLYKPEEALKIGLVDELATDKADAIAKCEKYIASYNKISPDARSLTKMQLRRDTMSWLNENRELDVDIFINFLEQPQLQKGLDLYIQSLKNKSKL